LLHPDALQGLEAGDLTLPSWCILGVKGILQGITIQAHCVGIDLAWLLAL